MTKAIHISEYEKMKTPDLIEEVKQRRREVQKPELTMWDHVSNLLISTTVVGFGLASSLGFFINLKNTPENNAKSFNGELKHLLYGGKQEKGIGNRWSKSSDGFQKTLKYSASLFALSSVVAAPIVNYLQRSERAEDNATMYLFGRNELKHRGYSESLDGNFVHKLELERYNSALRGKQEGAEIGG